MRRGFSTLESGRSPLVSITRASGVQGRSGQGLQLVSNEVRLAGVLESCSLDAAKNETGRKGINHRSNRRRLLWRPVLVNDKARSIPHDAVPGELLPRRLRVQKENELLASPETLAGGETMAAIEARLAGFHDVLDIDNSIVMR
jgi:hypothetical protein